VAHTQRFHSLSQSGFGAIAARPGSKLASNFSTIRPIGLKCNVVTGILHNTRIKVFNRLRGQKKKGPILPAFLHELGDRGVPTESVRLIEHEQEAKPVRVTPAEHVPVYLANDEGPCTVLKSF
jgi:hypothetical protein